MTTGLNCPCVDLCNRASAAVVLVMRVFCISLPGNLSCFDIFLAPTFSTFSLLCFTLLRQIELSDEEWRRLRARRYLVLDRVRYLGMSCWSFLSVLDFFCVVLFLCVVILGWASVASCAL